MGFAMKGFALFAAFFLIISCSDSDKFSGEKSQRIRIEGIFYEPEELGKVSLYADLQAEKNCCSGTCTTFSDCYWIINGKCRISSKNLGACYIKDYLWIIDNDTIPSFENPYNAGYGEHLVKLVLVDAFGDSINYSDSIKMDEPLKVELLSPVRGFNFSETDSIIFQYKISGVDSWEKADSSVYVSATKDLLWEEENKLPSDVFKPPWDELTYFWGVIVHTEFESYIESDTSEIGCIGTGC